MTWQRKLALALCLSALCSFSCVCSAEPVYTITETELTRLEVNLNKLQVQRQQLLSKLETLNAQQVKLEQQLATLKALSQTQETQLKTANEYLKQYEQEVKSKQNSLRRDRTIAWSVAGCLLVGVIAK